MKRRVYRTREVFFLIQNVLIPSGSFLISLVIKDSNNSNLSINSVHRGIFPMLSLNKLYISVISMIKSFLIDSNHCKQL